MTENWSVLTPTFPSCREGRPINDANALTSRRHNSSVTSLALSLSGQGLLEGTVVIFENNGIALEASSGFVSYSECGLDLELTFRQELAFCVRVCLWLVVASVKLVHTF